MAPSSPTTRKSAHSYYAHSGALALALLHPGCTGTEADNPFRDPTTTSACKGSDEYVPLSYQREALSLEQSLSDQIRSIGPVPARAPARESRLSPLSEIPTWLECLAWDFSAGILDYQIANFSGGCAIDWTGGASELSPGHVNIELSNNSCSLARCGSCLYDARSSGTLELTDASETLRLDLIQKDCEGEVTNNSQWTLPLGEQDHGMLCRQADEWGAAKNNDETAINAGLYAPCGDTLNDRASEQSCADGFNCVDARCVPPCTTDMGCPLNGALTCEQGHCKLPQ